MNAMTTFNTACNSLRGSRSASRIRAWGVSALVLLSAAFALQAPVANALEISWQGPNDMRHFVGNLNPMFGCSGASGNITWTGATVYGPSNMDVVAYQSNYVSYSTGGQWIRFGSGSPTPSNGYSIPRNQRAQFGSMFMKTPSGRYYYATTKIDIYQASGGVPQTFLGTVWLKPNSVYDWTSTPYYPYASGGISYCYK